MKLTRGLLEGVAENEANIIKHLTIRDMDITSCLGCMSCWGKTAGKCVIDDVMTTVYQEIMKADLIIESFPLYFFGMKTFTDRMMPLMETYKGECMTIGDNAFHAPRFAIPPLEPQVNLYVNRYREIGRLLGRGEVVPDELVKKASEPILPQKAFETLVNNYWNACV